MINDIDGSNALYYPAGYFVSGVARRLSREIVGHTVYHDCPAYYFFDRDPVCQHREKCVPTAVHQRRQISGVLRMRSLTIVIMASGVGESFSRARRSGMYVKSEKT